MIGYKAFDKDLKCLNFQYEIGNIYEFDGIPVPCKQGFHFCKSIANVYRYYNMNEDTRICKVEAIGEVSTDDEIKYCTNKIKICEEIIEDWKRKGNTNSSSNGYCNTGNRNAGNQNTGNVNTGNCNTGSFNTGYKNTGDCNTGSFNTGHRNTGDRNIGNWNSGNRNTGNYNTGCFNTGHRNTGDCNVGNNNIGNCNTGYCNIGHYNAGDQNTGHQNTGSYNTGHQNTGNYNTGDCNTGDWNNTNSSSGCFNTKEKGIWMFDKPTELTIDEWRNSDAFHILKYIPIKIVEWIDAIEMSDEEKEKYPSYKTTGGYLKELNEKESAQEYWNGLSEDDKQEIYNLPNFDKDIFMQCTGINIYC